MKKWTLAWIVLGVSGAFLVQVAYAANPASQPYVCERDLASAQDDSIKIGDFYQGGVVYYLDNSTVPKKGLIVVLTDADYTLSVHCTTSPAYNLPYGACFWAAYNNPTPAIGQGYFTGQSNTSALLTIDPSSTAFPAAYVAHQYSTPQDPIDAYWYLPSQSELMQMWSVLTQINTTITAHGGSILPSFTTLPVSLVFPYWSSTESGANPYSAWSVVFGFGFVNANYNKKLMQFGVRPVRTFTY